MSFHRLIAGAGIAAVTAATLVVGSAPATALERLTASPIVTPISSLVAPPTSYPSQPLLPTVPDDPTDASIARGVTPYDEIAPFLNTLMAQSDRISAQVVGQSTLGRDIHLVTLTAKESPDQTAKQKAWRELIKADPDAAAKNKPLMNQYKVPIWFNGNIHGNEWEGTDGILNYIEYLATAPVARGARPPAGLPHLLHGDEQPRRPCARHSAPTPTASTSTAT